MSYWLKVKTSNLNFYLSQRKINTLLRMKKKISLFVSNNFMNKNFLYGFRSYENYNNMEKKYNI